MDYKVIEVEDNYMLEATDGSIISMPRPWSPFLPGDIVRLNPLPKLVYRKPRDIECIVVNANSGLIRLQSIKHPKFRQSATSHIYVPVGTKFLVHLSKEGGIMPLNILSYPVSEHRVLKGPTLAPHIGLVYR